MGEVTYVEDPSLSPLSVLQCHSSSTETNLNDTRHQSTSAAKTIQILVGVAVNDFIVVNLVDNIAGD